MSLALGGMVGWMVGLSVGRLAGWSVDGCWPGVWRVGWMAGRPVGWLVSRWVDWFVGWSVGGLAGWMVGLSVGRLAGWSGEGGRPRPLDLGCVDDKLDDDVDGDSFLLSLLHPSIFSPPFTPLPSVPFPSPSPISVPLPFFPSRVPYLSQRNCYAPGRAAPGRAYIKVTELQGEKQ